MYISQLKSHGQLGHLATLVSNFTDRHQAGLFKTLESVSCQDFNSMIQEDAFFSVPTTEVAIVQLPLSCKKWCFRFHLCCEAIFTSIGQAELCAQKRPVQVAQSQPLCAGMKNEGFCKSSFPGQDLNIRSAFRPREDETSGLSTGSALEHV